LYVKEAKYLVDSLADQEVKPEETKQGRIEFSFPLLIVRTQVFGGIFDKLGALRVSRLLSWIALIIVPIVAAIGLYLLSSSLFTLLWTPVARDVTRELGPAAYLLLPGVNPFLPILYGWFAIVCAIGVHEGAHGIIARNRGLKVKSSGLLFLLVIPIGAFVDVDEEQLTKTRAKDSLRVMAAGVGGNIVVAIACVLAVLVIVNGLTPAIDGVYIYDVIEGMPADVEGLLPEDVFVSVDNVQIDRYETLNELFEDKNPGDTVQVTVARGEEWVDHFSTSITLTESEGRAVMGVTLGDLMTEERLNFYKTLNLETLSIYMVPPALAPGLVPFSDSLASFYTHTLGTEWKVYANVFFWMWFVNINVAIFNALPIYPLDGGRIFDISLKSVLGRRLSEKTISRITYTVTATLILVLLLIVVIPFVL
jgi:membrane-associated protease RseP (regulator of RpoE activity)